MKKIVSYDTTLRDGSQAEDISFSVEDKLRILKKLIEFDIPYIEGGWPGANPKDVEFFEKAKEVDEKSSKLVAFGATHKAGMKVDEDPSIQALLDSGVSVITIFGKTWDFHVKEALRISNEENLELIYNTVRYLKGKVDMVFFDAEHFFDGYKANPEYAIECLEAAVRAGANCIGSRLDT